MNRKNHDGWRIGFRRSWSWIGASSSWMNRYLANLMFWVVTTNGPIQQLFGPFSGGVQRVHNTHDSCVSVALLEP